MGNGGSINKMAATLNHIYKRQLNSTLHLLLLLFIFYSIYCCQILLHLKEYIKLPKVIFQLQVIICDNNFWTMSFYMFIKTIFNNFCNIELLAFQPALCDLLFCGLLFMYL